MVGASLAPKIVMVSVAAGVVPEILSVKVYVKISSTLSPASKASALFAT